MAEEKQLSVEDLKMWVEFVTFEKINGEEPTEKQIKQLERLAKRTVTLADASSIAQYLVRLETQADIRNLSTTLDAMFFILKDKFDVTPDDLEKAFEEREKVIQEQLKEEMKEDEEIKDSKGEKHSNVVSIDKEGK